MTIASGLAEAPLNPRPYRADLAASWPRETIPGSPANYWRLDYDTINNMQWLVSQKNHTVAIFPDAHACVVGTVAEVIREQDGDIHIWVNLDGTTKGRFACEITPQQALPVPAVGDHIRVYGIFRYDLQHSWPEIHPVDYWQKVAAAPVIVPAHAAMGLPTAPVVAAPSPIQPVTPGRFPYRLGRKPKLFDRRTLRLASYLRPELPAAPPSLDIAEGISAWGMLANDRYGDCTCAAAAHMEMVWSRIAGQPKDFTDEQVLDLYNRCNNGADDGANELFVLNEWRHNGLGGSKIYAFAEVPPADIALVRQAAYIFSGLYLGVALPVTAQAQIQAQQPWDVVANGPSAQAWSWGGHAVSIIAYDDSGLTCVTWGRLQRMTWGFWQQYVEEAWAIIPEDFEQLPVGQKIVGALDFNQLVSDLQAIGGRPAPQAGWNPGVSRPR